MSSLTTETTRSVLDAAIAAATEVGLRCTAAVVDAGGHLLGLLRMDGSPLAALEAAQVKARTAVYFQTATANLPGDQPFTAALIGAVGYPVAFIGGGIPLLDDGVIIGAIGVGGGTAVQDGHAATVAAATFNRASSGQ